MNETRKKATKTDSKKGGPVEHKSLDAALVAAQSELRNTKKDSVNPHFKSRYTQLSTLLEDIEPVLNKHGLYVTTTCRIQWQLYQRESTVSDEGGVTTSSFAGHVMCCAIIHGATSASRSSEAFVEPQKGPQPFGAYMTYMRRYLIQGLVGVAEGNDDDGEGQQQQYRSQGAGNAGGGGNSQLRSAVGNGRRGR